MIDVSVCGRLQSALVQLISKNGNLSVVGDLDQVLIVTVSFSIDSMFLSSSMGFKELTNDSSLRS